MKKSKTNLEKLNNKQKNTGYTKIDQLFNRKNKFNNRKYKNVNNEVYDKFSTINIDRHKENNIMTIDKKSKNIKIANKKIFDASIRQSIKEIKKQKSKTINNSNRSNRHKKSIKNKKMIDSQAISSSSPQHKTNIYELENKKREKKKYNIKDIFSNPIKYINTNINFNNYFTTNKINTNNNIIIDKNSPTSTKTDNKHKNSKKLININKKNLNEKKDNEKNSKKKKNVKNVKKNEKVNNNNINIINDTEVNYINNDNEDVTESVEKEKNEKEKLIIINDIEKYFKNVDSLNNEEFDDYYNESPNKNDNNFKKIFFDDEISSINTQIKEKKTIVQYRKKTSNKIESPIKIEIKQDIKIKDNNVENIKTDNNDDKNKQNQKFQKIIKHNQKEDNEFNKLLYNNKTFKKFLQNKIKYYIKENKIPYQFINSLEIPQEKTINDKNKKIINISYANYDNFYDSNKNNLIKRVHYNSKDEKNIMNNKNINSIDKTNYEKLEIDNFKKTNEIKKLKERINDQKKVIIEKKEIINELQNINHNLEQKIFDLKNNQKYNSNKNINRNNYEKYNNNYSLEKLIDRRNKLMKMRDITNEEYFNLYSNKNENSEYRIMLEKKLDKINNSLIEIRNVIKQIK